MGVLGVLPAKLGEYVDDRVQLGVHVGEPIIDNGEPLSDVQPQLGQAALDFQQRDPVSSSMIGNSRPARSSLGMEGDGLARVNGANEVAILTTP